MADIDKEIAAFNARETELTAQHMGKWVLFHAQDLFGVYDSFDAAAKDAVHHFGRGPYLIRQVGAPPVVLPASVMYRLVHA